MGVRLREPIELHQVQHRVDTLLGLGRRQSLQLQGIGEILSDAFMKQQVLLLEELLLEELLEKLMEFASVESCGKCFPCRLGTKRAHEMFKLAGQEDYKIDRALLDDLLHTLEEGSLCMHGGGIPLPVRNALQYFGDELSRHFSKEVAHV